VAMKDEEWALKQNIKFVLGHASPEERRELWVFYVEAVITLQIIPRAVASRLTMKFWKDARANGSKAAIKKWGWLIPDYHATIKEIETFLNKKR
jgi:hypothetical protein